MSLLSFSFYDLTRRDSGVVRMMDIEAEFGAIFDSEPLQSAESFVE